MDANLTWTVTPGGAVDSYEIRRTIDGGAPEVIGTSTGATLAAVAFVDADHVYTFTVVAINAFGSAQSNTETLDTRQPGAPVLTVGIP